MTRLSTQQTIEEIIIIMAGIVVVVGVMPFAIYRFINGDYNVAIMETSGVVLIVSISLYVWKTRKTRSASILISIFMLTGLVGVTYSLGTSLLFWLYPTIIAIYFLNKKLIATLIITPSIIALLPALLPIMTSIEITNFITTIIISMLFGYVTTDTTRKQFLRLNKMIDRDALTGLLNRRSLDERLDLLQNLYFRSLHDENNVSSIIIFDIDDFKEINDQYGHQEGDRILIELAKLISKTIRKTDELFRYGGEEFVLIANGLSLIEASELAEKIRGLIENSAVCKHKKITGSFGVAEVQRLEHYSLWLARADKAMYRAKRAGKNRVFLANYEQLDIEPTTLAYNTEA